MAVLAKALVALGVPVDIVADMDILNSVDVLQRVIETLGGDWAIVQPIAAAVKTAIEQHKPWLNADEIKKGIAEILDGVPSTGEFPRHQRSEIESIFRKAFSMGCYQERR